MNLYIKRGKRATITHFSINDPGRPRGKGHRVQQKAKGSLTQYSLLPLLPVAAAAT